MPEISLLQVFAEVGYQVAGGGGHRAMSVLRTVVPVEAYEFLAFDPATGEHRSVLSEGRIRGSASLRAAMTSKRPVPVADRCGLTAPLYLAEGRYTGGLHLSSAQPMGDDTHALIAAASPMLAHVTDLTRCVIDPVGVPAGFGAVAFDRLGNAREVPNVPGSAALLEEPAVRDYARDFIDSRELSRRGLWLDARGRWHEVHLTRAGVGFHGSLQGTVVAERVCGLPYELTGREVDVLTRVAAGDSNPQIAAALVLSVRTVTTHLEHIFAKLGCDSRTRLTTKALAEGLCRLEI